MARDTVVPIPLKNPATKDYAAIFNQGLGSIVTLQIGDRVVLRTEMTELLSLQANKAAAQRRHRLRICSRAIRRI